MSAREKSAYVPLEQIALSRPQLQPPGRPSAQPCFSRPLPLSGFLGTPRISAVLLLPLPSTRPVGYPCLVQDPRLGHFLLSLAAFGWATCLIGEETEPGG